jgi:hypothetical protein
MGQTFLCLKRYLPYWGGMFEFPHYQFLASIGWKFAISPE